MRDVMFFSENYRPRVIKIPCTSAIIIGYDPTDHVLMMLVIMPFKFRRGFFRPDRIVARVYATLAEINYEEC